MTHKSPYAWPSSPARAPQHTGQPGKLPARSRARRALKLAAVASVWVTGLAVVVIAVAMVAMTTAPSAGFTASAAAGRASGQAGQAGHAGQPAPHARAIKPARPAVTSLVFSGQGSANTTPFVIGGPGRWKVTWSYDCGGEPPGLTIRQAPAPAGPAASGLTVTRSGASGHGAAWADHEPGQHTLRIRTACAWHLAVTSYS